LKEGMDVLFKVRKKDGGKILKVYHVKTDFMLDYPEFLVFDQENQKWTWILASETEPVD